MALSPTNYHEIHDLPGLARAALVGSRVLNINASSTNERRARYFQTSKIYYLEVTADQHARNRLANSK